MWQKGPPNRLHFCFKAIFWFFRMSSQLSRCPTLTFVAVVVIIVLLMSHSKVISDLFDYLAKIIQDWNSLVHYQEQQKLFYLLNSHLFFKLTHIFITPAHSRCANQQFRHSVLKNLQLENTQVAPPPLEKSYL